MFKNDVRVRFLPKICCAVNLDLNSHQYPTFKNISLFQVYERFKAVVTLSTSASESVKDNPSVMRSGSLLEKR